MTAPASAAGPTSTAAVADWLQQIHEDPATLEQLAPTVAAVNRMVRRFHDPAVPATADTPAVWNDDHVLGSTMLAARLWRRRKSIEGVMAQFSAEGGVYVQRHDPDVAMLLQLGAWSPPVVG